MYTLTKYLILTPGRYKGLDVKLLSQLKKQTQIPSNAIALKLHLELPDSLFTKPQLQASISVPDNQIGQKVINVEILENIKETVRQNIGVDLSIALVEPNTV